MGRIGAAVIGRRLTDRRVRTGDKMATVSLRAKARPVLVGGRLWLGYVGLQVLAGVFLYAAVPLLGLPPLVEVISQALAGLSVGVAMLVGVARHRPAHRAPWYLLTAATVAYTVGLALFYIHHSVLHDASFPALADPFYLAFYLLVSAALVLFVRRRTPGWDLVGTVDAGILVVGAGLLSWVFLISPSAYAADVPMLTRVVSAAYPMLDLLMLAVAARLMLGAGVRTMALRLVSGFALLFLVTDTTYGVQSLLGMFEPGLHLEVGWFTAMCLLGAAALHPSMRRLDERSAAAAPAAGPRRLTVLAGASLMAPTVLAIQYARGADPQIPVVVAGCVMLFLLVMIRMAGLVRAQRQVAITDGLTGLHTRRFFEEAIATETARALRTGSSLGLLILDIDHFKRVNDRYGHNGGDRVLCEVADRLRSSVRPGDVVARYGGEEFAVLLPQAGERDIVGTGERIRTSLAGAPIVVNQKTSISVSVSVGAAALPEHGRTPAELVLAADRALYAAKQTGRNRLVIGRVGGQEQQVVADASRLTITEYLVALTGEVEARVAPVEHGAAVGRWAAVVAEELGLDQETWQRCALAGRLHDIGKITVPEAILRKPGRLSGAEWGLMKTHADEGARLLRLDPELADVARIVRQHHERYDGSGYPDGRTGANTTIEARIVAVCDAWAAMRVDRPYQTARSVAEAVAELRRCAGSQFDPDVVDAFLAALADGRIDEISDAGGGDWRHADRRVALGAR
jgi:two-component system cell cycle response regulator